jgi:hypothetical protein
MGRQLSLSPTNFLSQDLYERRCICGRGPHLVCTALFRGDSPALLIVVAAGLTFAIARQQGPRVLSEGKSCPTCAC